MFSKKTRDCVCNQCISFYDKLKKYMSMLLPIAIVGIAFTESNVTSILIGYALFVIFHHIIKLSDKIDNIKGPWY